MIVPMTCLLQHVPMTCLLQLPDLRSALWSGNTADAKALQLLCPGQVNDF